jgi:hypothetical protein
VAWLAGWKARVPCTGVKVHGPRRGPCAPALSRDPLEDPAGHLRALRHGPARIVYHPPTLDNVVQGGIGQKKCGIFPGTDPGPARGPSDPGGPSGSAGGVGGVGPGVPAGLAALIGAAKGEGWEDQGRGAFPGFR